MLRRGIVPVVLVLVSAAALLALPLVDVNGSGVVFGFFAVQGIVALWLMRSLGAAAIPVATAVLCASVGSQLVDSGSELTFPIVLGLWLLASLPGALIGLVGAFAAGERPARRVPPAGTTVIFLATAGFVIGGCGGGSTGSGDSGRVTNAGPAAALASTTPPSSAVSPAPTTPRPAATAPATTAGSHPTTPELDELRERIPGGSSRPPARTLPNGSVVIPPPTPTTTEQPASDACDQETIDRDGVPTTVEVPPEPGLRAEIVGDSVRVIVDTGQPPARCAPDYLSVSVQVGTELRSPVSRQQRLDRLGQQTFTLPLPDGSGAGVVRATTGTDAGHISPTASIALR